MATGFGFCPNCGTPRVAAEQKFCAGCGANLTMVVPPGPAVVVTPPVVAAEPPAATAPKAHEKAAPEPAPAPEPAAAQAVAPAPEPAPWMTAVSPPPPAPEPETAAEASAAPPATPPVPPAYATGPAPYQAGAPVPAAPSAPAKPLVTIGSVNVTPKMAAIAGIALAAILVVGYFVSSGSKSSGITVTPSTYSCSSTAVVTVVMRLPATVKATDPLVFQQDGKTIDTTGFSIKVSDMFTLQPDGTWTYTRSDTAKSNCTGSSGTTLSMGTHTVAILDASGHVLAQGSFTLTP
ncbi:MAG: zinc ribbon domain-containing protein [Candidatus Limnocylindrales bacterium]